MDYLWTNSGFLQKNLRLCLNIGTKRTDESSLRLRPSMSWTLWSKWGTKSSLPEPLWQDIISLINENLCGHFIGQLVKWNANNASVNSAMSKHKVSSSEHNTAKTTNDPSSCWPSKTHNKQKEEEKSSNSEQLWQSNLSLINFNWTLTLYWSERPCLRWVNLFLWRSPIFLLAFSTKGCY